MNKEKKTTLKQCSKSLMDIDDDDEKMKIIYSLKDEKEKIKAIKKYVEEPENKIIIASTLKDRRLIDKWCLPEKRKYSRIGINPKMTFAPEIEVEGECSNKIIEAKNILFRKQGKEERSWEAEKDASLTTNYSVELHPSEKAIDDEEITKEIYIICNMLKKCGLETNALCGLHVHIGADYFGKKPGKFDKCCKTLTTIWTNTESIMYLIGNKEGQLPRTAASFFARSISKLVEETKETLRLRKRAVNKDDFKNEKKPFSKEISGYQKRKQRNYSINFANLDTNKHTIEFRLFNGTLNPDLLIENIRLAGRLIEKTKKIVEGKDKKLIKSYKKLQEDIPEEEKAKILFEMLFPEKEERKPYEKRYEANSQLKKKGNEEEER